MKALAKRCLLGGRPYRDVTCAERDTLANFLRIRLAVGRIRSSAKRTHHRLDAIISISHLIPLITTVLVGTATSGDPKGWD